MICVSISDCTVEECLALLDGLKLAEIRMESISGMTDAAAKTIFSGPVKLVAACRPGKMPEGERKKLLLSAIGAGAAYVDIEVDAPDAYKQEIAALAKAKGCKVIASFHDYQKTPVREELEQIIGWGFDSGADMVKIACNANSEQDSARLLGLLDTKHKLIVIGMGEKGRIVRVVAPLLGSCLSYASVSKGKESAPGQMTAGELEKAMKAIRDAEG